MKNYSNSNSAIIQPKPVAPRRPSSRILVGSIAALLAAHSAQAANQIWTGGSVVDGNWGTILNWDGAVPGSTSILNSTDIATFNAAIANTWGLTGTPIVIDSATQNIGGISFDLAADNYFLGSTGGNSLLLSSGGTIQILNTLTATNAIETINAPLVIQGAGGTYAFANNSANGAGAGAGTLNFGGGITGGAAGATVLTLSGTNTNANTISGTIANGSATSLAITKSGAGTWVLSGANSYTGATTISAGTLKLGGTGSGANSPLGTTAGTTSVTATGAALDLGGFTITTAEALSLTGTGTSATTGALTNSGGAASYSGVVTIAAAATTIGGTGDITLSAALATNANSFVKVGAGKLTLSVNSARTGSTQIDGGILRIGDATAFGTAATTITINNGGTLEIGTANTIATGGGISLNNGGTITDGLAGNARIDKTITVQASATAVVTFNSGTTASNVLTINGGANNRLTGGATGAKIQITGSGEVRVGETAQGRTANVTSDWYLQSGKLRIRADGSLGATANDLYFQGGTLITDLAFTLGTSRVLDFSNAAGGTVDTTGGNLTLGTAGQLLGANKLTKAGANLLIMSAANGGFTGEVNVTAGTVRANDGTGLNTGSLLTLNGGVLETGANLARTGGNSAGNMQITGGTSGFSAQGGAVQVAFGTLGSPTALTWGSAPFAPTTLMLNASTADNSLEFKNAIDLGASVRTVQTDASAATMSGNLTGTGGTLTKTGNGTLNLSGTNSHDTGTNVNAGVLTFLNTNAKPGSGTTTVAATATLGLGVGGAGFFSATDVSDLFGNTMAGVSMNATSGVGIDTTAGNFTHSSALAGTRPLAKLGANTLTLSGPNTYSGTTTVNGGILQAGVASVANVSGAFGNNSAVTLANTAGVALDLNGYNTQIGSLAGGGAAGGNVTLGTNTLTVGGNNTGTTYAGVISSSAGVTGVSLNKNGSGQFQLDRANTYTGKTVIAGGTLYATEANATLADAKLGAVPGVFQADNITISNGGRLFLASGNDGRSLSANRGIYLDTGTQRIDTGSGDFYMNPVISGPGGLFHGHSGGGYRRLYLFGANTHTGDTSWDASGSTANYGGINMNNPLALQNSAVDANSINSWLGISTSGGVLQLGGLVGGNRSLANLTSNGTFTGLILNPTIAGVTKTYTNVIGGTNEASTTVRKTGLGTQALNGASTYTGKTFIDAGVLSINTIKNVGGVANSLGQPTTVANGTIDIGNTTSGATLLYTGTGDTTDRVLNLAGTTGGATLDQSGASGVLTFSSNLTATGAGAKTLTLQGSTGGSGVLGGSIVDSGGGAASLTKTGSGTWTLNGASTFTGDTTHNGGTLTIGNVLALQNSALNYMTGTLSFSGGINTPTFGGLKGSTSLSLASNVTDLTLNPGTGVTHTYSGTLGSDLPGMNLTKTGAGTQLLGAATYTGTTAVSVGKLYLNGSNTTSAITVAGSATLGGNGTAASATATVADTGIVEAGSGGLGTLSLGGLDFTNTGTVNVANIGNYSVNAAVSVLNSNALVANGAAGSVTIALTGTAPGGTGTVHLIQYSGAIGGTGFGAFAVNAAGLSAGPRALFTLANNPGFVDLNYSLDNPVWSGLGDGNWITSANLTVVPNTNWKLVSNLSTQTNFIASDAALFNDTASAFTVTISAADVAPASVTFNNTANNYTLQGAFAITGGAALTKSGSGRLTVTNDNNYSGGTTIGAGGTVQVGGGGTTGTLGSGTITDDGVLEFNRSGLLAVTNTIGGTGAVTKNGVGEVILSGPNSYGGNTSLNTGTLTLGHATALGSGTGSLIVNGGILDSSVPSLVLTSNNGQVWNSDFTFAGTNDLNLGTGAVSLGSTAGVRTFTVASGVLTVGGAISDGVATGLTKVGAGTLVLGGASSYTGGTIVDAGTVTMNDGATLGAVAGALAVNNPNTGAGTDVVLNLDGSVTTGPLSGALAIPSGGTNTATINIAATKTFTVNQTADGTYDGTLAGSGAFVKGGANMLTLSGASTSFTGATTLNQGTLSINSLSALGTTGTINVSGGTFQYTGSASISTDRFLITSGNVAFDITQSTGNLTITNQFTNAIFTKLGAGTLTFGGNVYFTGNLGEIQLVVNQGTVVLASSVTDPAFTDTVQSVNDVLPGATLMLGNANGRQVRPTNTFHMSGGTFDLNGNNNNFSPLIDGSGTITNSAAGSSVLRVYPSGNKTFSGDIVNGIGSLGLTTANTAGFNTYGINPASTWTLSGNNTYSGPTTVGVSILQAGSTTAFSANSAYTVNSTLDAASYDNSVGALSGTGNVTLGTAALTVGNQNSSPAAFSGVISSSGSPVTSLVKVGTGTLTLTGGNTYTGLTVVKNGTLSFNSIAAGAAAQPLGENASLTLGDAGLSSGVLSYTGAAATLDKSISVLGTGNDTIQNSGTGPLTLSGGITGADTTLTINGASDTTITAAVNLGATSGALIKDGAGLLNIDAGTAQTYKTLTTVVGAGTTNVNSPLTATGGTDVVANGNLKFGSVSQALSSLTIGAGATVVFTSGTASGALSGGGEGKAPGFGGGAVVPEPGTLGLLLVGALGMLNRRRRA